MDTIGSLLNSYAGSDSVEDDLASEIRELRHTTPEFERFPLLDRILHDITSELVLRKSQRARQKP